MSRMRWMVCGAMGIGIGVVATAVGCSGNDAGDETGVAQIALTQVPSDGSVGCVAVTATGATTVTRSTNVMPGASSVLDLHGLPTGTVSFTGNAYAGACNQVTPASVPTWLSDPVLATVSHVPVFVTLIMKQNGQATVGVDFPGGSCRADGAPCFSGAECCSNTCAGNACQAACPPDGDGGCACPPDGDGGCACPTGLLSCAGACVDPTSDPSNCGLCGLVCPTGFACAAGGCTPGAPTCSDGIKDGTETDVDCGGACSACAAGKGCVASFDCQSGVCAGNICQFPTCSDAIKDGTETDVDCGGACPACAVGQSCAAAFDCQSGVCLFGKCSAPSCSDGLKNGTETDVDCGGVCAACVTGKACMVGGDCVSGLCTSGLCQ